MSTTAGVFCPGCGRTEAVQDRPSTARAINTHMSHCHEKQEVAAVMAEDLPLFARLNLNWSRVPGIKKVGRR